MALDIYGHPRIFFKKEWCFLGVYVALEDFGGHYDLTIRWRS
jgi:hypothetical protein